MKKIFVTGGTGFIGGLLVQRLVEEGHQVVTLLRSPEKAHQLAHPNIQLVKGDLSDVEALEKGMKDATEVYHLAAFASVWAAGNTFEEVNIDGTVNVLQAARKMGVQKVVITSTAGVIGPAIDGPVNEDTKREVDFFTDYERTKYKSEIIAKEYAAQGQHIVIVNPTRVYGPGPLNVSNSVTKLIKQYSEGSWKFMPGDGNSTGNYVFVEDVVNGQLLAMDNGRSGERYLLGGEDATYHKLFDTIGELAGKKHQLYKMPLALMLAFGKLQLFLAEQFGRQPMITPGWVRKYLYTWEVSSAKAQKELGYQVTPLREGIQKTLAWLNDK